MKKALHIAQAMETADKYAEDMQAAAEPPAVGEHKVNRVKNQLTNHRLMEGGTPRPLFIVVVVSTWEKTAASGTLIAMCVARNVT